MALSNEDRLKIAANVMSDESATWEVFGNFSKEDWKATIDAIDDWIDDNMVSFNQAIPVPCRTELTTKQKVRIFMEIIKRRWEVD